jgi:hypothetical protein
MTSEVLIRFMQRMIKDAGRMVFLVLDNTRVHHKKVVQAWLEEHRKQIEVFFQPSYSPELKPDEFMNGDLKMNMSTIEPTRGGEHLKKKVVSHLRSIRSQPQKVWSYFRAKPVAYAPNGCAVSSGRSYELTRKQAIPRWCMQDKEITFDTGMSPLLGLMFKRDGLKMLSRKLSRNRKRPKMGFGRFL